MRKWIWLVTLLFACGGEGETKVDCTAVCQGLCGSVQGCDCGSCDTGGAETTGPCVPDCTDKECGDDGCGGSCGECEDGCPLQETCDGFQCVSTCAPDCEGKACGDDGCGCSCGECPDGFSCWDFTCKSDCTPDCTGRECGNDGCGGSCGDCPEHHVCLDDGSCLCQPECTEKECGDDGCGGSCGDCPEQHACLDDGSCLCQPACSEKECGDDGCDGSCGDCPPSHDCLESGQCICVPDCTGKECGGDGCNGLCGSCGCGENCTLAGQCLFTACADKECGSDGCGGSCGSCAQGAYCVDGTCPPPGDVCFDDNEVDWDGCTGGELTEFQVNLFTAGFQGAPTLAVAGDGAFLVAWQSDGEDGNGPGVFARAYGPDGLALGDPEGINQESYGAQKRAAAAALTQGGYVVAWESTGQDGFMEGIFARRIGAGGLPTGAEFQVNQFVNFSQTFPAALPLAEGAFLLAWQSDSKDGSGTGVVARRFLADGSPEGPESVVNEYLLGDQGGPAGARFPDGRTVLTWNSFQQDGGAWGVYARRFDAAGEAEGAEFQVNTETDDHQVWPAAAVVNATDFVVAWQSAGQDGSDNGVYAQRFGASYKLGQEFRLNDETAGRQEAVGIVPLPGGGFAAAWHSCPALGSPAPGQDGAGCGVFWRRFDDKGQAKGAEAAVNVHWAGEEQQPAIGAGSDGTVVLAWESCPAGGIPEAGQDGDGCGIFARRFEADGSPLYH
jgi:hypothetical protein